MESRMLPTPAHWQLNKQKTAGSAANEAKVNLGNLRDFDRLF
jgi:hypothetical protein